jgi:hypothetical protein
MPPNSGLPSKYANACNKNQQNNPDARASLVKLKKNNLLYNTIYTYISRNSMK